MSQITPTQNMLLSSISDDNIRYRIEQFIQDHDLSTNTIEDLCRLANDFSACLTKAYNQGYSDGADSYDTKNDTTYDITNQAGDVIVSDLPDEASVIGASENLKKWNRYQMDINVDEAKDWQLTNSRSVTYTNYFPVKEEK